MDKIKQNNLLQGFSNPMQNLLSLMSGIAYNMGDDYMTVVEDLDNAERLIRDALKKAQHITFKMK